VEKESYQEIISWLARKLSGPSESLFLSLPVEIARQLLADRDPHGNVQVSRIETEKLLIGMVEKELGERKAAGAYKGKFSALGHFFGYEGRCAFPSNFDADYCYSLGFSAFVLIAAGLTGYISSVRNLISPAEQWIAGGAPLTMMMNLERRHGSQKPVIRKALVELEGAPFKAFAEHRDAWALETGYLFPGAVQYFGPPEIADITTATLTLERGGRA
jgi:pyrophosphate--fructose-6-phosphate 1-phosphotransferase